MLTLGEKYGRLTVIDSTKKFANCRCDCGKKITTRTSYLRNGNKRSCGCAATKHGDYGTPFYKIWVVMKRRCLKPDAESYRLHEEKGIELYPEWRDYEKFRRDMWGGYSEGLSLIRTDREGPYSPENCQWLRPEDVQVTLDGITRCLSDWSSLTGVSPATIHKRLDRGWPVEEALREISCKKTTPTA